MDFTFGYITGGTGEEATAFASGIAKARKQKISRRILEFGPSAKPAGFSPTHPHKWASKFKVTRLSHAADDKDVVSKLTKVKRVGVLSAWGHGMPDGVHDGLKGKQLREAELDLRSMLYFSGPCYCGVTNRWFGSEGGRIAEKKVPLTSSFLLALIRARVAGAFAGLDPDRGEINHHELEHLLLTGEPLGMASKSTYDDVVVAYRRGSLKLPRYRAGKRAPYRDIHDQMISGGACRALFGDPTFQPFSKSGEDPFEVGTVWTRKGLEVTWHGSNDLGKFWTRVDVFRAGGGWTDRIRFRFTLPKDKAKKLKRFRVQSVTKDGKRLEFVYPTAALEDWGGEVRVHGLVVFPPDPKKRALRGGKKYEARFLFEK